jgi:hypothetical protein
MIHDHQRGQFAYQKYQENKSISNDIYHSAFSWTMPFGKHKGKVISAVPADYLDFIRRTTNNLDTARRCSDEIERRHRIEHLKIK